MHYPESDKSYGVGRRALTHVYTPTHVYTLHIKCVVAQLQ